MYETKSFHTKDHHLKNTFKPSELIWPIKNVTLFIHYINITYYLVNK